MDAIPSEGNWNSILPADYMVEYRAGVARFSKPYLDRQRPPLSCFLCLVAAGSCHNHEEGLVVYRNDSRHIGCRDRGHPALFRSPTERVGLSGKLRRCISGVLARSFVATETEIQNGVATA